jgi:hypothetical protein
VAEIGLKQAKKALKSWTVFTREQTCRFYITGIKLKKKEYYKG